MDSCDISVLEERIKNIIIKIRKGRSRPCYQNILNFINRGDIKVQMDSLKTVLNDLVERNVLEMKGDTDRESFYVIDGGDSTETLEEIAEIVDIENNILSTSAENFIQEKFHETLINMINVEVKKALSELSVDELSVKKLCKLNTSDIIKTHVQESQECVSDNDNGNVLISVLKSEITFLRNEMNSKDEIIKLLINDRNTLMKTINTSGKDLNTNSYNKNKVEVDKKENNNNNKDAKQAACNDNIQKFKQVKKSITIVGDSLSKEIKPVKLRKSLQKNERVYIKTFPGATTQDMDFYIQPSLTHKPDTLVLHVGTNNLRTDESANEIAEKIVKLATDAKKNVNEVAVSSIVFRDDDLYEKAKEVNNILQRKAAENYLHFIDNNNLKKRDLNGSGLHLNPEGSKILEKNILRFINK